MIPVSEESLKLRWLAGAPWWVCLGLCVAFVVGRWGLGLSLETQPFVDILILLAGSNVLLYIRPMSASRRLIAVTVGIDVVLLTAVLFFYGGSANPLSSLYFLYVMLASILMRPTWAWGVATLCFLCFGSLFFSFIPIPELVASHMHHQSSFSTHLQGMLITFVFTSYVIVYFITRLASALKSYEFGLEELRESHRRSERLAGLTTLAAGAAHELRNPLGAIAVSISELDRELKASLPNSDLLIEVRSISLAVLRCQKIIDDLCGSAGVVGGEPITALSVESLIEALLDHLPNREMCTITVHPSVTEASFKTFSSSFVQALLSLVRNGLEYGEVALEVSRVDKATLCRVCDSGPGMSAHVQSRIGEPFFTTKGPGGGMGLGLFIAKTFAERMGGVLSFEPILPRGTAATLCIPDLV